MTATAEPLKNNRETKQYSPARAAIRKLLHHRSAQVGLIILGIMLLIAILARDYPVVTGFTLIIALIFIFVNMVVDLSYAYLDPRIRLE